MSRPDYKASYLSRVSQLSQTMPKDTAMSIAVGGDFDAAGKLEYWLLRDCGLQPEHTVVDVGCGSGRLAVHVKDYLKGRFIGLDIVPELFNYAAEKCARPDWRFYEAPGLNIPEPDNSADFICFFSVFTHLLHEESFKYLQDAARVLKPQGRIVISFLEFAVKSHWHVFMHRSADTNPNKVLCQFVSRDALAAWAEHAGLQIVTFHAGNEPHIPFEGTVKWANGVEMTGMGALGQSVCVMTKP